MTTTIVLIAMWSVVLGVCVSAEVADDNRLRSGGIILGVATLVTNIALAT